MPGLDPGIHTIGPQRTILRMSWLHGLMDRRVKPGDDGGVRRASAERDGY